MLAGCSRKGDRTYARLVTSRRVDGKVVKETSDLGRVVDRRRNVFRSRERGTSALDTSTPGPASSARHPRAGGRCRRRGWSSTSATRGRSTRWRPRRACGGRWTRRRRPTPTSSGACACTTRSRPRSPTAWPGAGGRAAGRASPTPRPASRPSARASCRGASATRRRRGGPSTRASRGVFCQVKLSKRDCGGNLGPRLARSLSQLHGKGYGPSPGHVVRIRHHPYDSPISGRFP